MENMTDAAIADLLYRVMTGRSPVFTLSSTQEGRRFEEWMRRTHLTESMAVSIKTIMQDPACFCWAGAAYDSVMRMAATGGGPAPITVTAEMAAALLAMSYDQDFQREAAKSAGYGSYTIPDRAFWEGDPDEISDSE